MPPPGEQDALIGTVIDGRFEIRDKLGQGGMGTVYRAWQRSVGREVAIKLIDRSISSDPMATQRFLREAHLASQLSHPNTISVLDFGQMPDGRLFTAMELLRGRTLGRELRQHGKLSLERIVRIGVQLCDALEAAHALRIVHRDLKLDNVMLLDQSNDLIKVLDFGLAKTLDDNSTQATAAGIVVGTPRYIAPESAMTGEATPASDMYAVGVMLAELALAAPLWEGATLSVILQSQLKPEPIVATVPRPLRDVVARLLDVKPERRPTAAEARKLLQRPAAATPKPKPPSRKYALLAAGTIVFVGSVVIAYVATRTSEKPKQAQKPAPTPTPTPAPADPWADSPPEVPGDLAPLLPAPAERRLVQVLFVGVPQDAYVTIDNQPVDSLVAHVEKSDKPRLVAVRQRDTQVLFEAKSVVFDRATKLDFTTKQLADCDTQLSSKSRRYCQSVFCDRHRDAPECAAPP